MMTLASVLDPLRAANRLARAPIFAWQLRSPSGAPVVLTSGVEIDVEGAFEGDETGDLLFVIAGFNQDMHAPRTLLPKINRAASRFTTIASIEAGTWVLARADVLHNHTVTTHWEDLENLAFAHPQLTVVNQRFVIDGNIWSSGGASPALDMMLHYLRTHQRQSLALDVANVFIYNENLSTFNETDTLTSTQFRSPVNWLDRVEPKLAKAIRLMDESIEEPIAIPHIAQQIKVSHRMLELLFSKHLGMAPITYYLRLRLQAARRMVLDTNQTMVEVAIRAGFTNASSFARAFKRHFGRTPSQMRKDAIAPR